MSKATDIIRMAYQKGYRIIEGNPVSPRGKRRKCTTVTSHPPPYLRFNVSVGSGRAFPVCVHRLVAYQKYGEESLKEGVHVRHRDNNSINNLEDNILLGTPTENMMDVPSEQRREHAAKGNQRHSEKFVEEIRLKHDSGISYNVLSEMYGVPKSTLSYYLSKTAKKTTYTYQF
jgi:hypothetical protein